MQRMTFRAFLLTILAATAWGTLPAYAAENLGFRRHDIDAQATNSTCATIDVNHDGKLDIVAGGHWYEAPSWKKHFVRDVEVIRGRFDDYSSLPLDVNGDGWIDLISANYRSATLYWVEHPGKTILEKPDTLWATHLIQKPGPMETARLHDVDGDGQLDVLPNGVRFAAWWQLNRQKSGNIKWIRNELPPEVAAHGIGFGDINGDGRGDIVTPNGWAEAPKDRKQGRWNWHPEFKLHRDGSVPMLVRDVDADGDADIVWGRAHGVGLYWLEQQKKNDVREWQFHVIDTTWTQPHSLLWGDFDGNGKPELIAGKRYMAHDGKDLGEYDPLVVASYEFDGKLRTWKRRLISTSYDVGFGLDPKLVDLDTDGDLDLVCSGRSGLFLLENLRRGKTGEANTLRLKSAEYDSHRQLAFYRDSNDKPQPIKTRGGWARRRSHIHFGMHAAMGALPDPSRRVPLDVKTLSVEKSDKYTRHKITFASEPGDRVPAYLLVPHDLKAKAPAMLCLHQTTGIGKGEPAGLGGKPGLHYAHELAERGYVCLVPDYPSFGDYTFDFAAYQDRYASGTMKAIWNNMRAVDLLETLPYVNRDAIGCIGHSLGGHNSLFTAAFEQRIKAVVTSCGFTGFHDYYGGKVAGWTSDRYIPLIRTKYNLDADKLPFDFYEVLAAIAPRAIFVNAPLHDSNFDVGGVRKVMAEVGKVYTLWDAPGELRAVHPDAQHSFPDAIRKQAYDWLDERLQK